MLARIRPLALLLAMGAGACSAPERHGARDGAPGGTGKVRVTADELRPPDTPRREVLETMHGVEVNDPFRWLERADDPDVEAWVERQDTYARHLLASLPGRGSLRRRLEALARIEEVTAPVRRGTRFFFSHRHGNQDKPVYYVRESERGDPRVLVDPNTPENAGMSIQDVVVSDDGRLAALRVSQNNQDEAEIRVLDVDTGAFSEVDTIPGIRYVSPSWARGAPAFYYTRLPTDPSIAPAERAAHARIFLHKVGSRHEHDELVFDRTGDPHTLIGPDVSEDGRFLFVYVVRGAVSTDVYFKALKRSKSALRPLFVGKQARLFAAAHEGKIYARTNHGAERWKLVRIDDPNKADQWRDIVPEDPQAVLDGFSLVGGRLSLQYTRNASSEIKVAELDGRVIRTVPLPGIGLSEGLVGRPEDDTAYYEFSSFLQPATIYRTSVARGGGDVHAAVELPADPSAYPLHQVSYRSSDGTPVTMFVIEPRGFERGKPAPFLLSGYGGFGVSVLPRFDPFLYAWLEAGGGVAVANVRGGGEHGEAWHRAGMLTQKQNVFDDFIAAAKYLVAQGYTRPDKLAIRGGSNGGLLVGAAMTQQPELFRAVVCLYPLLDMLRFHLFGAAGRWTREYGSVDDPDQFKALHAYSPYHRVRPGTAYPALLLMSGDGDDRVDPAHARKFAAAVQAASSGGHPVLLRIERKGGHGGADRVAQRVEAELDELSFLLSELGVRLED